jgi:hypothetical protein
MMAKRIMLLKLGGLEGDWSCVVEFGCQHGCYKAPRPQALIGVRMPSRICHDHSGIQPRIPSGSLF